MRGLQPEGLLTGQSMLTGQRTRYSAIQVLSPTAHHLAAHATHLYKTGSNYKMQSAHAQITVQLKPVQTKSQATAHTCTSLSGALLLELVPVAMATVQDPRKQPPDALLYARMLIVARGAGALWRTPPPPPPPPRYCCCCCSGRWRDGFGAGRSQKMSSASVRMSLKVRHMV